MSRSIFIKQCSTKVVVHQVACFQVEGQGAHNVRYSILQNIEFHFLCFVSKVRRYCSIFIHDVYVD